MRNMKKVAIRVDGGLDIGMGHVMRTLSLAKAFRKQGYKVYFLSKKKEGIKQIQEDNFDVVILKNNYNVNNLKNESKEIVNIVQELFIDILIIDLYNVTEEYFLIIKPHVKRLVYIDDLNKFVYPVDILINSNITAEYMNYNKYSKEETILLGPKYNLLREEFINLPKKEIKPKVKEIMVTTGGTDPFNMTSRILSWLLNDKKLKLLTYHVIVGKGFQNKEELKIISKSNPDVILYENIQKISEIMLKSDIAISAGGGTLYELLACGTPTLAFVMAENQKYTVERLEELGYIKSLGDYRNLTHDILIKSIKLLCEDTKIRISYSNKQLNCINGVDKIVKVLTEKSNSI